MGILRLEAYKGAIPPQLSAVMANTMQLCIPTNWQPDLLDKLNKTKVIEIYGKLKEDAVGGGRSSVSLRYISRQSVSEYVARVHNLGIRFNYLLNASCLGNSEWTARGQRRIRKLLDWLSEIKVDSITVSSPYLLSLAKKCYPNLELNVSVIAAVDSPQKARHWQDLGADQITLPNSLNRNFKLLKQIRKSLRCRLQLIANQVCLHEYPFCAFHYTSASHSSQERVKINKFFNFNYYPALCRYLSILEPYRLISAGWIRPEDLVYYRQIGIDRIKLVDRRMDTQRLLCVTEAYTSEKYEGNLFDILFYRANDSPKMTWLEKFYYLLNFKEMNLLKIHRYMSSLQIRDNIYLDNKKLSGFIDFFLQGQCKRGDCYECDYCKGIAEKLCVIAPEYKEKMTVAYKQFLEDIIDGSLFYVNR